jgi:hypothetical protein
MAPIPHEGPIPVAIAGPLGGIRRQVKARDATRGLGTFLLIAALGIAAGAFADFAFALPPGARWLAWGLWMVSSVTILGRGVIRPLTRRVPWLELAAIAERAHPELGERLTAAVALSTGREPAHGSPQLIAAVIDEAGRSIQERDLTGAIPGRGARGRLIAGLSAAALVALPVALRPDPFAAMAGRFLAPWERTERIGRYLVTVDHGDRVVAIGDDVPLVAVVRPRFGSSPSTERAYLVWTGPDGRPHRLPMAADPLARDGPRTWRITRPAVSASFRYRVVSGEARSRGHTVTAIPAPAIASLHVKIEPPAYTGRHATTLDNPSRIDAWEGSEVTFTITPDRRIKRAELAWPDGAVGARRQRVIPGLASGAAWTVHAPAVVSGPYSIRFTDGHDLRNHEDQSRHLVVRPDAPPTVVFADSDDGLREVSPDDRLSAAIEARDDLAVAAAEIHYMVRRATSSAEPETGQVALKLPGLGRPVVRGDASLDLRPLGLHAGDSLSYRVRVLDSRPEPNEAWTEQRELSIVAKADPLLARRGAAERERLQATLNALKRDAAETRKGAEQLRYAADAALRNNGRWEASRQQDLHHRETAARDLVDRLHLFGRELSRASRFGTLTRPVRQVADVEAEAARQRLDQALRAADAAERLEELKQADASLAAVQTRLDELQRKFDELARIDGDRRRLAAMADRQEDLAHEASQLSREHEAQLDRARLDQVQARQAKLAQELEEMLRRSPALRAEALAAHAEQAATLAAQARELADRQRDEARQTGDLSRNDDELRALAEAQRELEDDARRFALSVDFPLVENGRSRFNADALAQPVEPLLRGDTEQAHERLVNADHELRRLARDLDDVREDPKAFARRLARRQEQLRNQIRETIRQTVTDRDDPADDELKALTERLGPLIDRQEAIGRLIAALPAPGEQQEAKKQAIERQSQATECLRGTKLDQADARLSAARDALNHLADVLPDPHAQRQAARQQIEEARRTTNEVADEMERHLRETAPRPGRPHDAERASAELAERLAPLAQRQAQAAADLGALRIDRPLEPQRQRAARRSEALAQALAGSRRDALPALAADARAAAERLARKADGRLPADEHAAELAAELAALGQLPDAGERAREARRIAAALRGLDVPDAVLWRDEAARAADLAAQPRGTEDRRLLADAAKAAEALARRLTDVEPAAEQTAALGRAERALGGPEGPRDPSSIVRAQRTIAGALARIRDEAGRTAPEAAHAAAEAVGRAALMAERVANRDASDDQPPPTPGAVASACRDAAQRLDELAIALAGPDAAKLASPDPAPTDNPQARAEELLRRQRELAGAVFTAHERTQADPDRNAALARLAGELGPLIGRQEQLLAETRLLDDTRSPSAPERRVIEALTRRDPRRAADLASEAAVKLELLAQVLPDRAPEPDPADAPVPDDPALGIEPEQVEEAHALAGRQRRILERLQALLTERVPAQQRLRESSTELARQFAELGDRAREISPRAQGPASQAADLLGNHAPPAMDQSSRQLAHGQPNAARESQRRAAEMLERAAQQAEDLLAALRTDTPPEAAVRPAAGSVSQAQSAQREAARQLAEARDAAQGLEATEAASQSMRRAAEGLRQASQPGEELASQEPGGAPPSLANRDPQSRPAGRAEADLAELQELVRSTTGRNWGELPGHLRTELLRMPQGRYRDEYARLIQLYFREIATNGRTPER